MCNRSVLAVPEQALNRTPRASDERSRRRGRGSAEQDEGDEEAEDASDASEGDASDDDRPKKRGRPPASHRERIKGFTDPEVSSRGAGVG